VTVHRSTRNDWAAGFDHVALTRTIPQSHPITIGALPQDLTLDLSRSALIVVDMQNDFCHEHGWLAGIGVDISGARAAIEPISAILPVLRGLGVPVIWVNWGNRPDQANLPPGVRHVYDAAGTGIGIGSLENEARTPVLEAGSWSAGIVDELRPPDGAPDILIDKYRMSGFVDTALDSILRNLRVDTLLFAGVNADQCVLNTLTDAANLGYDVVMLEDASGTTSPDFCAEATVYNVRQCYGFTTTTAQLLAAANITRD
jgi:ureidoacrylate peracid hydrolase